jgi:hypothetical protein
LYILHAGSGMLTTLGVISSPKCKLKKCTNNTQVIRGTVTKRLGYTFHVVYMYYGSTFPEIFTTDVSHQNKTKKIIKSIDCLLHIFVDVYS